MIAIYVSTQNRITKTCMSIPIDQTDHNTGKKVMNMYYKKETIAYE